MLLLICFGSLLAAGLFFLAADLLRLPYVRTSRAMINTARERKRAAKSLEVSHNRKACSCCEERRGGNRGGNAGPAGSGAHYLLFRKQCHAESGKPNRASQEKSCANHRNYKRGR